MPTSTQKPTYADEISLNEMVLPADGACFHCGEAVPKKPFFAEVLGQSRAMCCLGCQLAAQSIVEAGLEQYYLDRRVISPTAPLPDVMNFDVYNHDDIKSQFTYQEDGAMVAELSVVGIKCAACTWLIEKRLRQVDGVGFCQVNLTQQRMRVAWNDGQVQIGEILSAVNSVGYHAKPYRQDTHEAMMKRQNKQMLIRLAVAGFGAMQAMMFSVGLYFGEYSGMAVEHKEFLRLVSMIVSIPVIAFAGVPFFASAWSALKARQVNMDVPVSIALILTFLASSYATLTHQGETYFDSVSMFIFFLLAGRYVEQNARLKAANMASDLVVVEPKLVTKLGADIPFAKALHGSLSDNLSDNASPLDTAQKINDWSSLHLFINTNNTNAKSDVHKVAVGDIVQVPAGGEIVGDGVLLSEMANVSQSLLTGESNLITKVRGDKLLGGSQNDAVPLVMIITETADNSQIALIDRLINRAMSEKPQIAQDADRMARWFVARVLVLAVLVFVVWWFVNPSQALWATVAVLVATCPCALSLATPIALTVATNRLAGLGFLSTRGHTIQTLSEISHVAFDKTGTLTTGRAELLSIKTSLNTDDVLAIAAALEVGSVHPVALSLSKSAKQLHLPRVDNLNHHAGGGVSGVIDGRVYRLGHAKFATGQVMKLALDEHDANMAVVLAYQDVTCQDIACQEIAHQDIAEPSDDVWQVSAVFYFNDRLRADGAMVLDKLKSANLQPIMLTGDPSPAAQALADKLGIHAKIGLLPQDKVNEIKDLQLQGKVLMVGDGINDAPVLAAADVSVAMAGAADLAQVSADGVLLGETLSPIVEAIHLAKKTQIIIRQNLRWAFFYNLAVLLPAALGYVPPWLAAIGMSVSSLFVVLNAMRLKRG